MLEGIFNLIAGCQSSLSSLHVAKSYGRAVFAKHLRLMTQLLLAESSCVLFGSNQCGPTYNKNRPKCASLVDRRNSLARSHRRGVER